MSDNQSEETEDFGDTVESRARQFIKDPNLVPHDLLLITQAVRLAKSRMPENPDA